ERANRLAKKALGVSIVGGGEAGCSSVIVRHGLDGRISERPGNGPRVLAELSRLRQVAGHPRILAHVDRHPGQSPRVAEDSGQTLGLAKSGEHRLRLPEREE